MRKVVIDENNLTSIANAIRNKNGETIQYKPNQMASAIDNIKTGEKPTETIEITKNGVYDVVNYATANVNTPEPKEEQSKTITITENGTQNITPDENKVLSNVEVITDVPVGVFPTGNIEIIENGTYDVTNYASANVDVPSKITQPKTITENGVYNAIDDGVDGYDVVTVNTGKYKPRFISFRGFTGTELDYELNNIDTSSMQDMSNMFNGCRNLKSIPQLDTSNVTTMQGMFQYCNALIELPLFEAGKVKNINGMFMGNMIITNMGGFKDLGKSYEKTWGANYSPYKLDLSKFKLLTYESVMNIGNNLYDIASIGVQPQNVILSSDTMALLSETDIAVFTNKGWNVTA